MYGVGRSLDFRVADLRCWEEIREKGEGFTFVNHHSKSTLSVKTRTGIKFKVLVRLEKHFFHPFL